MLLLVLYEYRFRLWLYTFTFACHVLTVHEKFLFSVQPIIVFAKEKGQLGLFHTTPLNSLLTQDNILGILHITSFRTNTGHVANHHVPFMQNVSIRIPQLSLPTLPCHAPTHQSSPHSLCLY